MSIGKKLSELLQSQDISELELAEHLGISPDRLTTYLHDKREPDINTLNKAAKFLSVSLDYFADEPFDLDEQFCKGLTMGYVEDVRWQLADHQRLVDYLIYEIDDLSKETLDNKHVVYTYMLALSNQRIGKISEELNEYTLKERKRILGVNN